METVHESTPSSTGTPAPYGRSCTNCVRAKCRCVYQSGGLRCERCHRLQKECTPSERKRRARRPPGSRTAQLEEKLDDLVILLRTQNTSKSSSVVDASSTNVESNTPSTDTLVENSIADALNETQRDLQAAITSQHPAPASGQQCLLNSPFVPDALEAEEQLTIFRKHMLNYFPFTYIPPEMTAKQLREERPFLWFNIMTITTTPVGQQFALGDTIKQYVAQKMVVEHEKSLDLLQGLMVFIAWTHYYRKEKPYLTVICSLATSLVFDLGLNKDPGDINILMFFKAYDALYNQYSKKHFSSSKEKTMEERRAVLGLFYLTSQVALTLKKLDALSWTPYMDECLDVLTQQAEWEGDHRLVAQVKIHLVADQLYRAPWKSVEYGPPAFFMPTLQTRMQNIKDQLSPSILTNDAIASQLLYTDLIIQDTALLSSRSSPNNPDMHRHQLLDTHLQTIKAWFAMFFSIPIQAHVGGTFAIWTHLAHCLMSLHRVYTLDGDPAWMGRSALMGDLDLFEVCDKLAKGFDAVSATRREKFVSEGDLFFHCTRIIRSMRDGWMAEIQAANKMGAGTGTGTEVADNNDNNDAAEGFVDGGLAGAEAMPQFMDYESWLTDIFNVSWE